MKPMQALRLSLLTTLVLWFTGVVVVPFVGQGAKDLLPLSGVSYGQNFYWFASQFENLAYTLGRVPLLFAVFLVFSGGCDLPKNSNMVTFAVMVIGAAVTALCSGWLQIAGFVLVVSGLLVRVAVALRGCK